MTDSSKPNKALTMPFILAVAGGSGSGKTYFAQALQKRMGADRCEIVYQDNFYIDQSQRFDFDGGSVNFDHPESLDFELLAQHLAVLKKGLATEIPIYDFTTHQRKPEKLLVLPKVLIIVDGILILHPPALRALFDDLVFFDTPEALRYARRLERDVKERGRRAEGVLKQFQTQVKPMHDQFVEPSKQFAHTRVSEAAEFEALLDKYVQKAKLQKV